MKLKRKLWRAVLSEIDREPPIPSFRLANRSLVAVREPTTSDEENVQEELSLTSKIQAACCCTIRTQWATRD